MMEAFIRVMLIKMEKKIVTENVFIQMETSSMVCGKKIKEMVRVRIYGGGNVINMKVIKSSLKKLIL